MENSIHSNQVSVERRKRSSSKKSNLQKVSKNNIFSRLLALPTLLAVIWGCWQVTQIGLASAWYFNADNYLTLWNNNENLLSDEQFRQANHAIDKAIQLHPSHPHYLLTKAKISEWGWYRGLLTSEQLDQQDSIYQRAIAMRKSWPSAYADYAYYLGVTQKHITAAFEQLELAHKYGPLMPDTFVKTITVGYFNWPVLNTAQKAMTLQALQHAVLNDYNSYRQALHLSKISGKLDLACRFLKAGQANYTETQLKQIQRDFCNNRSN